VAAFVVIGRLMSGSGARMDFVRDVGTVFAESLWDRTVTCVAEVDCTVYSGVG